MDIMTAPVHISSREHKANPYPFYAYLRAEAPVYRALLTPKQPVWLVARYDDASAVLKDERLVKNRFNAMSDDQIVKIPWSPGFLRAIEQNMLDLDAPDHTRLRALVHKAFTPRLIERMREEIQILADDLLDAAAYKNDIDLIRDFALPLPLIVIARMLGVPEKDMHKFHKWTNRVLQAQTGFQQIMVLPAIVSFIRYLRRLFEERRARPQDDLITALVQAEEAGDRLSEDELLAMGFILIIAGHETTVNLIGNGTLALLENPDQMTMLRDDPSLIKTAVEELLRYTSPVETATERYAREDITIAGVMIPRGEMVMAALASANRDETQFDHADVLDIMRTDNKHLAFGQGIHYCVGAPLARMEGHIAINTLLHRMPHLQLATPANTLRWRPTVAVRGLEALPVTF